MDIEIRPLAPDEVDAYIYADAYGFGDDVSALETIMDIARKGIEVERVLCALDGGKIIGAVSTHPYEISVPGGSLPLGAISNAFVFPTHRRRGILTTLMERQLKNVHERGEPLSALTASESLIYGRYGYGIGAFSERWSIEKQHTAFAHSPEWKGRTRFVGPDEVMTLFPEVYRRATAGRPGVMQPPSWAWERVALDPPGPWRRGGTPLFYVVYEEDSRVDGYATYRLRGDRGSSKTAVRELMAVTMSAYAALWRYCFDIDLRARTEANNRPVDDPLYWMLADPRRLERVARDFLWLRIVDASAALSGRRYMTSDGLVFEVKDSFCPWNEGCYELIGGPDGAECRPSRKRPDLALWAADLSAAYLGTVRFTTLARASRVDEHTRGALLRADAMFASELQPWCPYDF
ncbi:MAG: GNAT family N-acetyltransferase [Chloroflexi bacterium]|nr:GNAT family N-acetyltransferase [Chloroflexota bacterium]